MSAVEIRTHMNVTDIWCIIWPIRMLDCLRCFWPGASHTNQISVTLVIICTAVTIVVTSTQEIPPVLQLVQIVCSLVWTV